MSKQKQEWDSSSYLKRKAERRQQVPAQWVTNPDTGEKFYLRRAGPIAYTVAGYMPHTLTEDAIAAWAEKGVKAEVNADDDSDGENANETQAKMSEGRRSIQLMAKVVQEACVLPRLVPGGNGAGSLDPADLDDSDMLFIFRWATGITDGSEVSLKGGKSMKVQELKSVSGKSGKRSGTIARG